VSEFKLRPLTIKWSDWTIRMRALPRPIRPYDAQVILRDVSAWQKRIDEWILSLPGDQIRDLIQLADAEIDMLFASLDRMSPEFMEDDRLEFRTRFYELQPLIATVTRLALPGYEWVTDMLCSLEAYAKERTDWLP